MKEKAIAEHAVTVVAVAMVLSFVTTEAIGAVASDRAVPASEELEKSVLAVDAHDIKTV